MLVNCFRATCLETENSKLPCLYNYKTETVVSRLLSPKTSKVVNDICGKNIFVVNMIFMGNLINFCKHYIIIYRVVMLTQMVLWLEPCLHVS